MFESMVLEYINDNLPHEIFLDYLKEHGPVNNLNFKKDIKEKFTFLQLCHLLAHYGNPRTRKTVQKTLRERKLGTMCYEFLELICKGQVNPRNLRYENMDSNS